MLPLTPTLVFPSHNLLSVEQNINTLDTAHTSTWPCGLWPARRDESASQPCMSACTALRSCAGAAHASPRPQFLCKSIRNGSGINIMGQKRKGLYRPTGGPALLDIWKAWVYREAMQLRFTAACNSVIVYELWSMAPRE